MYEAAGHTIAKPKPTVQTIITAYITQTFVNHLKSVQDTLIKWKEDKGKILAQLQSIINLQEQLDAIKRCKSKGNIGVLNNFPGALNILEGKILASQQRAMTFIERDRKVMSSLVSTAQNKAKLIEQLFTDAVGRNGLEPCIYRTVEKFSLCDYTSWAEEIRHVIYTDWLEMRSVLMIATVPKSGLRMENLKKAHEVWMQGGVRLEEYHQMIDYVDTNLSKK